MNKSVVVTGGAGYVGSHACKALAQAGMTPIVYDNLVRGNRWAVKWGPFEEGDIQDGDRLKGVFQKYKPVAIMHFAAYAYVGESIHEPAMYYNNNLTGSLSLVNAALASGIDKIIFSSTCATYGLPHHQFINEAHPQEPINPYGASKLMVERVLRDYGEAYGLSYAILRYFNAAGADPDGEIGESHDPETHLIPLALQAAMGESGALKIFGSDYDTPDGTCVRDYIHVHDLASAHVKALERLLSAKKNIIVNLGVGHGSSVLDIVKAIENVTGLCMQTEVVERRVGDPSVLIASADLAQRILGWKPKYTDIRETIQTAYEWERKIT